MPAWMTSELRELVCVPMASSASRITTSRPDRARARATASPTTPAPITTASSFSTCQPPFEEERAQPGECGGIGHRARTAVESRAEQRADQRAEGEAQGAEQRGYGARRAGKRRQRARLRARGDERGAEEVEGEWHHHGEPMRRTGPGQRRGGGARKEREPRAGTHERSEE